MIYHDESDALKNLIVEMRSHPFIFSPVRWGWYCYEDGITDYYLH
jgi:hypothetical protein